MKLYAICWQEDRCPPVPAQGPEFDRDESPVPSQAFFWDATEAKEALASHMKTALAFSVEDHRRRTPEGREPPLSEDQLRGLLEDEWSIRVYEVPTPSPQPTPEQVEELKDALPKPNVDFTD